MAEDSKEKIIRYLTDSHASEVGGIEEIKQVEAETFDPDVKAVLNDHITAAQTQVDRLEARLGALGGQPSAAKAGFNSLIGKGSHLANIFHDKSDKQTQDTIKLLALAHFQAGAYAALNAYAQAVGDSETADLAATLQQEDMKGANQLLGLVPRLSLSAVSQTRGATLSA